MPVEIRELHVRVNVVPGPTAPGAGSQLAGGPKSANQDRRAATDDLVARCLEEVMEVLRNKEER